MSLVRVHAEIECDECGEHFKVSLDPAAKPPNGGSLYEIAEEAVRWPDELVNGSSVAEDGRMLCPKCTRDEAGAADD